MATSKSQYSLRRLEPPHAMGVLHHFRRREHSISVLRGNPKYRESDSWDLSPRIFGGPEMVNILKGQYIKIFEQPGLHRDDVFLASRDGVRFVAYH